MNLEFLRLLRNILLRCTAIAVIFTLFMQITTVAGWSTWTDLAASVYHADPSDFAALVLGFFCTIKFFVVFVLLTPGLALHWTLKRELARKA